MPVGRQYQNQPPARPAIEATIPTAAEIARYLELMQPTPPGQEIAALSAVAEQLDTLGPDSRRRVLAYARDRYPEVISPAFDSIMGWTLGLLEAISKHSAAGGGSEADAELWEVLKGTKFDPDRAPVSR